MKAIMIWTCILVFTVSTGCATSPKEKLLNRCAEFEKTGKVPDETTLWDNILGMLVGFSVGVAIGGATVAGSDLTGLSGAEIGLIVGFDYAAMLSGAVLGWNIPAWGEKKYKTEEFNRICDDLKNNRYCGFKNEEDIPAGYFYKKTGLFGQVTFAEKGSTRQYNPLSLVQPDFMPRSEAAEQALESYKNKSLVSTVSGAAGLALMLAGVIAGLSAYSMDVDLWGFFLFIPIPRVTTSSGDQTTGNILKISGLSLSVLSMLFGSFADADLDRSLDEYNKLIKARKTAAANTDE